MRKTKEFIVETEGRDKGKRFLLTEMPASRAEKWALRALGAMARSGLEVPEHIANMGMMGVLAMGLKSILGADFREAEPLLDELMGCVQSVQPAMTRALIEDDIEEVQTRLLLRSEVLELHTGFSVAAYLSKIWEAAGERMRAADASLNTPTSTETSPSSSPQN